VSTLKQDPCVRRYAVFAEDPTFIPFTSVFGGSTFTNFFTKLPAARPRAPHGAPARGPRAGLHIKLTQLATLPHVSRAPCEACRVVVPSRARSTTLNGALGVGIKRLVARRGATVSRVRRAWCGHTTSVGSHYTA
jgi:hypothetical protein